MIAAELQEDAEMLENGTALLDAEVVSFRLQFSSWRFGHLINDATWLNNQARILHDDMCAQVRRLYVRAKELRSTVEKMTEVTA